MPEVRRLAELFARLGFVVGTTSVTDEVLSAVTAAALQAIDGAEAAAVTRGRDNEFETVAATSELALLVDQIQYELKSGPGIAAAVGHNVFHSNDLSRDRRWPEFAEQAVAATGVLSLMSFRMFFEESDLVASLNVYATQPDAFDDVAETTGLILATHAALALSGAERLKRIENLERALSTNRDIGVAVGILMKGHLTTKDEAFNMLRVASQHTHRNVGDLALDVIETGELQLPILPRRRH
jgi:hypothetical protein